MERIFWLHLKKCAGTSLRDALGDRYFETNRKEPMVFLGLDKSFWNDNLNNYRVPLGIFDYRRSLFAKTYLYTIEEWDSMHKICFVRNPYDRLISAYNYLRVREKKLLFARVLPKKLGFYYFVKLIPQMLATKRNRHFATHVAPIWGDISGENGEILMDEIFRVEDLEKDEVLLKLSLLGFNNIERKNSTRSVNKRKSYYTSKSKALVDVYYAEDIVNLNYSYYD